MGDGSSSSTATPVATAVVVVLVALMLVLVCVFVAEKRMRPLRYRDHSVPEFSVPLRFRESHRSTAAASADASDRHDCNATSLRKCLTDDVTTLMGCKELNVRCHHFDRDTEFHDSGDVVSVIEKNTAPNEGYALAIKTVADSCNPFHGDPLLISGSSESGDYVLGCLCKNPGYVGSENVLDPCTAVHICGGRVDDINRPLAQVNCLCDVTESPVRYADGQPSCRPLTVLEANDKYEDWSHIVPWSSDRLIDVRVFGATFRDNLKTSRLLDPCTNALTDATLQIHGAYYNERLKTCFFKDYGLPVRTGVLERTGAADGIEPVDGALPSGRHKYIRMIDRVGGARKIVNVRTELDLDLVAGGPGRGATTEVNVNLPAPLGVGARAQFWLDTSDQMLGGRCTGIWPTYGCAVEEYFSRNVHGVPTAGYRAPPATFMWATDEWNSAERMTSYGVKALESGVALDHAHLDATGDKMRAYGVKYCHRDTKNCLNGVLSFNDANDYTRHRDILTR